MKQVTQIFDCREDGYWCEVGPAGKLFTFKEYENGGALTAASKWYIEQKERIDPEQSRKKIGAVISHLKNLVESLKDEFPLAGTSEDVIFYIDEYEQTIVTRFGSINVYVNDQGLFGADIIVNWLSKETYPICSNMTLSGMADFLKHSPGSRYFKSFEPIELYLSEDNIEFIESWVELSK